MRFKRRLEIQKGTLDIAPLIDVVFLLLIFFMLTSSFIFQPGIKVNLPRAVSSEVIEENQWVIAVTAEDLLYLNERAVTLEELEEKLKQAAKDGKALLIHADRRVRLGRVVEIWDLCRTTGVSQVSIATKQKKED